MASDEQQLHIGGVPLKFPFKPYPTQLSMMAKVAFMRSVRAILHEPFHAGVVSRQIKKVFKFLHFFFCHVVCG